MLTKKSKIKFRITRSKKRNQIRSRKKGGANEPHNTPEGNDSKKRTVLYDFEKEQGSINELSVNAGDIVDELEVKDNWTWVKNSKDEVGYVPTSYLAQAPDIISDIISNNNNNYKTEDPWGGIHEDSYQSWG